MSDDPWAQGVPSLAVKSTGAGKPTGLGRGAAVQGVSLSSSSIGAGGDAAGMSSGVGTAGGFSAGTGGGNPFAASAGAGRGRGRGVGSFQVSSPASGAAGTGAAPASSVQEESGGLAGPGLGDLTELLEVIKNPPDLTIIRKNPNSPLYAARSFRALHLKEEILKGAFAMGFDRPSKIQETTLPIILAEPKTNLIAQSQSGTGKTAAFVICILTRVDLTKNYPQAIVFCPTYELALQNAAVVERMGQYMEGLKVIRAVKGGQRFPRGENITGHIIVGTPGTIMDFCLKLQIVDMSKIDVCTFDEADIMIGIHGHQDQSVRVQRKLPPTCQMLLFSATYESEVMHFAEAVIKNPTIMRLKREEESLDNIKQVFVVCESEQTKFEAISQIYRHLSVGQTMIFCRSKAGAASLATKINGLEMKVALLSGDLEMHEREAVIKRFREGHERVLISTNVSARGLDIDKVTVVVNYDLPTSGKSDTIADCDTYLHRIGRTGRFGKTGLAFNLVDGPRSKDVLNQIQAHFGREIQALNVHDFDAMQNLQK